MMSGDGPGPELGEDTQDETTQDGQMELLSPPMYSRVQEPDGSVYDLEILARKSGSIC